MRVGSEWFGQKHKKDVSKIGRRYQDGNWSQIGLQSLVVGDKEHA